MKTEVGRDVPHTIALDGPAASGKSSVGRGVCDVTGHMLFDTGMLYRCLTHMALSASVPVDDGPGLALLVAAHDISIEPRPGSALGYAVLVDGADSTSYLRTAEVDAHVSPVSAQPDVRDALLEPQRRVARENAVVMVGRDIGTVVLPDADMKLYLAASAEARARRRLRERLAAGKAEDYSDILDALRARDAFDSGREVAPLRVASDAVVVDTDRCGLWGVVEHLLRLIERWPDALTVDGGSAPCTEGTAVTNR
jgi:cytidylate kinase